MMKPVLVFMCTVLLVLQHCQLITSSTSTTTDTTTTDTTTTDTTTTDTTTTDTTATTTTAATTTTDATATTTTGPTSTAGSGTTGTGSTAAATGSTTAVTVECFDGNCTGSGCLGNVSKAEGFAVCVPAAGGSCKLVEDASGTDPVYAMSCHASVCVYAVGNEKITENCCSPAQCNNDIKILKGSAPSLVGAWSIVLPCLYMLAV